MFNQAALSVCRYPNGAIDRLLNLLGRRGESQRGLSAGTSARAGLAKQRPSDNTTNEDMRAMSRSPAMSGGKTRHWVTNSIDSNEFEVCDRLRTFVSMPAFWR